MMVKKNHSFHMVDMSPWPLFSSFSALIMVTGLTCWFNLQTMSLFIVGAMLTTLISFQWWRDVSRESSYQGLHTNIVSNGMKLGMILFITSEVLFFFSFFWGFFHNSLAPSLELGMAWPPNGITPFNPYQVPLLNTIILLASGVTITWAHHALMENFFSKSKTSLGLTLLLGVYFSFLQGLEYTDSSFCISDSSYGSSFFMMTGFHGLHVLIGSAFILVTLVRMTSFVFSKAHHFGFEAAAWYWHFVDVVWLLLYISLYWWGS